MKPATIATLQELDAVEWFVKVGCRDTDVAEVLGSWDGAIEHCTSDEWKDLTLEAANQYRERLMERSPQRLAEWNSIVDMVKPLIIALVARKIRDVVAAQSPLCQHA